MAESEWRSTRRQSTRLLQLVEEEVLAHEGNEWEGEDCWEAGAKGAIVMEGIVGMTLVERGNKKK